MIDMVELENEVVEAELEVGSPLPIILSAPHRRALTSFRTGRSRRPRPTSPVINKPDEKNISDSGQEWRCGTEERDLSPGEISANPFAAQLTLSTLGRAVEADATSAYLRVNHRGPTQRG